MTTKRFTAKDDQFLSDMGIAPESQGLSAMADLHAVELARVREDCHRELMRAGNEIAELQIRYHASVVRCEGLARQVSWLYLALFAVACFAGYLACR